MFSRAGWRVGTVFALALLAACQSVPPARFSTRETPDRYVLDARFSLRENGNAYQGRIHWQHSHAREDILVQDPFGGGIAELTAAHSGSRIVMHDGSISEAAEASVLMERLTGVALPVRSVARWLTGRSLPDHGVERDSAGRVVRLATDDWVVRYEYAPAGVSGDEGESTVLPGRINATHRRGSELKLVIDRWELEGD